MQGKTFVHIKILKGSLMCNTQVILNYTIQYPQFAAYTSIPFLQTLNEQYKQEALALEREARNALFCAAVRDYEARQEEDFPFAPYEVVRTFCPTLLSGGIISLYYDTYRFTGGAHGSTLRQADSWNIPSEAPIHLRELFPCDADAKDKIIAGVMDCIQKNPENYFPDYETLVRQNFNPKQFFLSPHCLNIFYQQYDIAPYSTGVPTFGLRLKELGVTESLQKI